MGLDQLIKKCAKGNRVAQAQLYRKFSPILFGICLKYSRNKVEAEDNLHDSFMTIFDKIDQFKFKGSFEGWIKRVTVNTILQKYRKQETLNLVSENIEAEDSELKSLDNDISLETLLSYIQALPHKYRLTFNLYVLDGLSHKEISKSLGTSVGTSKSNLARARAILKEQIEHSQVKAIVGLTIVFISGYII